MGRPGSPPNPRRKTPQSPTAVVHKDTLTGKCPPGPSSSEVNPPREDIAGTCCSQSCRPSGGRFIAVQWRVHAQCSRSPRHSVSEVAELQHEAPLTRTIGRISQLKYRRQSSIHDCRKTAPGGRKEPEGSLGGRLKYKRPASRQGCRVKQTPARGDSRKESAVW